MQATRRLVAALFLLCALQSSWGQAPSPAAGVQATNRGYFPRIAGKPAGYLYNQLQNFKSGRRKYEAMNHLVQHMPDAYLRDIAAYFSQLDLPYPAAQVTKLTQDEQQAAERLVRDGPMADVVYDSTQFLIERDLDAMVDYLRSISARPAQRIDRPRASPDVMGRGAKVYEQLCASCHGDKGQGVFSIYPALAGNRALSIESSNNLVQVIRKGGFLPSTQGNPRPFGMPPFEQVLSGEDIAAVATYVRQSWGNAAAAVSTLDVQRAR
jgi:cytochrome c553